MSSIGELDRIVKRLESLSSGIKTMSERIESDPEAKIFKLNQISLSLSGTSPLQGQIKEKHADDILLTGLADWANQNGSHFALRTPISIRCHSTQIANQSKISALDLHKAGSICRSCVEEYPIQFEKSPLNPYQCWRRGHRSMHFGFLMNYCMGPNAKGTWHFLHGSSIQTTQRLKLTLSSTNSGHVEPFPSDTPHMGRSMLLVVTVRMKNNSIREQGHNFNQILENQQLVSPHLSIGQIGLSQDGDEAQLLDTLSELTEQVDAFWRECGTSKRNNEGVISVALIHTSSDEDLQVFRGPIQKRTQCNVSIHNFEDLLPEQRRQLGLSREKFEPKERDLVICYYLDPILDMVVHDD
jgi:hypothetical protein